MASRCPSLWLAASLAACSPAAPAPVAPAAPTASAAATSAPDPGWEVPDPRAVRCGVDDRPRSVSSRLDPPLGGPDRLALALPAGRLALDAPPAGARLKPAPPPPEDDFVAPMPSPSLTIVRLPVTTSTGGPAPSPLDRVDPQYEVCAPLARPDEALGPVTFDLELASSGAPLRVLPRGPGATTPLVRCLMERACQLQATASPPGQATRLQVPLQVSRGAPAAPLHVDVATVVPRASLADLQEQMRAVTADIMRACGAVPGRARVRLSLDLVSAGEPRPRRVRRSPMRTLPPTNVVGHRTETLEGSVPDSVLLCVVNNLSQRSFMTSPAGQRTERLLLTWNP